MSDRAPYSRIYWTIVDDEKFALIFDNDAHLAAWLRMLLIADQAHPASALVPANARRSSVKALTEAGLIDVTGTRFRIHGLDAERTRRSGPARASANARWTHPKPDANALLGPDANALLGRDEDETRRDETRARTPRQIALKWLTDHGAAVPAGWVNTALNELVKVYGSDRLTALWDGAPPDVRTSKQFVQLAERSLAPTAGRNGSTPGGHTRTTQEVEDAFH